MTDDAAVERAERLMAKLPHGLAVEFRRLLSAVTEIKADRDALARRVAKAEARAERLEAGARAFMAYHEAAAENPDDTYGNMALYGEAEETCRAALSDEKKD